ncbi:conserved hypothetical protein [Ixodes scapularis]|uniref:GPR180/TMEM145 transmembrane domain-containing protein n=1 Tax=Ixodes scapularis TaxID=6945 RepID=B7PI68_IXOSC|nr:conserved hypothetical protein [Ixodes scapularis]|eukprot:XP_002404492.1 conserved hypothetical protein [Ixodes scapularis]
MEPLKQPQKRIVMALVAFYFDPGEVLYLYESPAGYGIVALRLVGWGWFVYATVFTLLHYPEKTAFYTRLFLLYTIW